MTENKRIFWNIVATYGRSLFSMACGLFTSRWVLLSLGQVDYGLYGVVGCLVVFIGFINGVLAGANSRFYAYAIGQARSAEDKVFALEECRHWFNTALAIHTVVPFVLMIVGYPIGEWAVRHWLTIPPDRVDTCVWVFRFVCLSTFVGMVNVPFQSMYTAKQYIAELTIYSFATTALNVIFGYYMITHPGDWLLGYSVWLCILAIIPNMIIAARACIVFPECRIHFSYMVDTARLKKVSSFAGWQMLGCFCGLLRTQGIAVLINKVFGPVANASMSVANTVNGHSNTLAGSLITAFSPAITTSCGEGNYERMKRLAFRSCKFALLLSLVFVLPLALELPTVLYLWLKEPPAYAIGLCWCMLAYYLVDVSTTGHLVVVNASGKIAGYHIVLSIVSIFTLPIAAAFALRGFGIYSVGAVLVFMIGLNTLGRVYFARRTMAMSSLYWLFQIVIPTLFVTSAVSCVGYCVRYCMVAGFIRVIVTTIVCECLFLPISWFVVLDKEERLFLKKRIMAKLAIK